jgi:NADH:ubiquinone oxidoreductase subunit F (NADH-binding)
VLPRVERLLDAINAAGLRGRGGAAFPTAIKAQLVASDHSRHKTVVVNAMEGEPAAHKDQSLLSIDPHLALDGAELLADAVGANRVVVCVPRERTSTMLHVQRALHEREGRRRHGATFELRTPPGRYIAGEESALVHWLDDNETLPQFRPRRGVPLRIGRGAVLVDNTETHANVALIARHGPHWFREVGTTNHPGTTLVSVSGAVQRPSVAEVALGTPLRDVLAAVGGDPEPAGLLLGGYGGVWIDGRRLDVGFDNDSLAALGASTGAGVIVVLPQRACAVAEVANITRWMANESARQCGPCAFGLPALAEDLVALRDGRDDTSSRLAQLRERLGVINGRGGCRHPDGVVRMVASALKVFGEEFARHASGRPCPPSRTHFATVPRLELEHELVWQ